MIREVCGKQGAPRRFTSANIHERNKMAKGKQNFIEVHFSFLFSRDLVLTVETWFGQGCPFNGRD